MSLPEDETQETTTPQPEWPAADLAPVPETPEPMPPEFAAPQLENDAAGEAQSTGEPAPTMEPPATPTLGPAPETTSQPAPGWASQPESAAFAEPRSEQSTGWAEPTSEPTSAGDDMAPAAAPNELGFVPMPVPPKPGPAPLDAETTAQPGDIAPAAAGMASEPEPEPTPAPPTSEPEPTFPAADAAAAGMASMAHIDDSPTTQTQVPPVTAISGLAAAQQAQSWQTQPAPSQWQQPSQPQPPSQQAAPSQPQSQWPQSQQSQWQQPQQPQAWQQQQAQQWQQPGQYPQQPGQYPQQPYGQQYPPQAYPPQGYQQPYYPAQQVPTYSTSAVVAFAGVLLAVFGIIDIVGGIYLLGQGPQLRDFISRTTVNLFGTVIDRDTMRALLSPAPGVLMVFGLMELLAGIGIFAHKGWARAIGIIAALVGLVVMIAGTSFAIALAPGFSVPLIGTIAVLIGYAFILVALLAGGSHFRRRNPQR